MRHLLSLALALLPAGALIAQQPERYTIDGDDIAVYNLAGLLRVEPGQGAVTVTGRPRRRRRLASQGGPG